MIYVRDSVHFLSALVWITSVGYGEYAEEVSAFVKDFIKSSGNNFWNSVFSLSVI